MDISKKIRNLRKKKGLNQFDLAELVNVSIDSIRRWESNKQLPRADELSRLAKVLNVSESELLNGPALHDWELRLITTKEEKNMSAGVIDLTGKTTNSSLEMSDSGMGLTLSASYDLWEDDAKFENLIEQIRHKRAVALRLRREDW